MTHPRDPLDRFFNATLRINHLRTLAAIAQLGQVRRVAEAFHVTQSAISKQVAEIESGLGEAVLRREGNAVVLTPIGQRLAARAADVLEQLDRTRHEIAALRSGLTGRLCVGAVASVNAWLVPQAILGLRRKAPDVAVAIEEGTAHGLLRRLDERAIDVAVVRMWQPAVHEGLASRVLTNEAIVMAAGVKHPLAARSQVDWADLMEATWITPRAGSGAHAAIADHLGARGLPMPVASVESISLALNVALLASGGFVCLLPKHLATALAADGRIAILPLDTGGLLSETRVFWREDEADASRALLVDCLAEASDAR